MSDLHLEERDAYDDALARDEWAIYVDDQRRELRREAEFDRLADDADERDAALDAIGVYDDREF